jgi:hypothetical protein
MDASFQDAVRFGDLRLRELFKRESGLHVRRSVSIKERCPSEPCGFFERVSRLLLGSLAPFKYTKGTHAIPVVALA